MNAALTAVESPELRSSCNALGMIMFSFFSSPGSHHATGAKQLFMQVPTRLSLVSVSLCFTNSATVITRKNLGHLIKQRVSQRSFKKMWSPGHGLGLGTVSVVYSCLTTSLLLCAKVQKEAPAHEADCSTSIAI